MQKQKNKEEGVTLIALVVSIIVLIILAGVSIAMLVGENGIITQAQRADELTTQAQQKEAIELAVASVQAQGTLELDKTKLETALQSQLGDTTYTLTENGDGSFQLQIVERSYYIDSTGEVITEENMIAIGSAEELKAFRDDVNSGNTYEGKYVYLTSDITLDINEEWEPIGLRIIDNSSSEENIPFCGIFNGMGHEINGIYINTTEIGQGLFGYIRNAKISNLTIGEQNSIQGGLSTAGVVGHCSSSVISNVCNKSDIYGNYSANSQVGGIAGVAGTNSTFLNCSNLGNISANGFLAGGIVGYCSNVQIKSCYNIGKITASSFLGGITGGTYRGNIIISNCYNKAEINSQGDNVGGIVGGIVEQTTLCSVSNSYNTGNIIGRDNIGGIYGYTIAQDIVQVSNNYYLEGTVNGQNELSAKEGVIVKSSEELQELTSVLGNAFKEDMSNINNGYPILTWQ